MISAIISLAENWQVLVPVLIVVIAIVWALMKFAVQRPKIVSMIKIVLESTKGWLTSILGDKFGPVYNALIASAEAVVDGNFTKEEAISTAKTIFAEAMKLTSIKLTTEEQEAVDSVILLIIDAIMKDKVAAKISIKSM